MKRKLGINSDCIIGANELATLERIKETGFECFFTANTNPRVAYALRKKADDLGLEFEFIHAPFRGINDMWLEGDAYRELYDGIIRAIDAAEVSGAKHIILHVSSGWNPPPVCDLGLSRYDEIVKYAGEKKVNVAFENLRKLGNHAYLMQRYEHEPHVGFCYDMGHEHCYTETVPYLDLFGDKTLCTHIHDNFGRPEDKTADGDFHLLPFHGNCDYETIMRKLDKYNYTGSLMLEVFNHIDDYKKLGAEKFIKEAYKRLVKLSEL